MIQIDVRNISWDLGRDVTYEILIEQLGGYEEAKSKSRDNGSLHAERLRKALLEYRRQYNIFEVGDKVVMISKRRAPKLWTWMHTTNWRPNHSLLNSGESYLSPFSNNEFRHATDAEIKAGKRLEVNDGST